VDAAFPGLGSLSASGQSLVSPSQSYQQIAAPAELQGQDYYAEAQIDKPTAYQGEQVLYTMRLYQALDPYGQIQYQPPAFSGFWSKPRPDQQTYMTQAGGRTYRVTELQHVLFPTVQGRSPSTQPGSSCLPTSRGRGGGDRQPAADVGRTVAACGRAGQLSRAPWGYEWKSAWTRPRPGSATLSPACDHHGVGNIEQVADPAWPDDTAWRAFDSKSTTDSQFQDGQLVGVRRIERVLCPRSRAIGRCQRPSFSYFDPAAGQYRTIGASR